MSVGIEKLFGKVVCQAIEKAGNGSGNYGINRFASCFICVRFAAVCSFPVS